MRNTQNDPVKTPHPVDIHVGQKLKERRKNLHLSQKKLGEVVGISFQQVQKYESGMNRIVASKLYEFSQVLDVPITDFFQGLYHQASLPPQQIQEEESDYEIEPLLDKSSLELIKLFRKIPDLKLKKHIIEIVKTITMSLKESKEIPLSE